MILALYLPLISIHLHGPPFEDQLRTPSLSFSPRFEWDSETPGLGKPEANMQPNFYISLGWELDVLILITEGTRVSKCLFSWTLV